VSFLPTRTVVLTGFTFPALLNPAAKLASRIFSRIVLYLGSLHLTLMAAIGIWFWSSPALFESRQHHDPLEPTSYLDCTSMVLLGQTIGLSSSSLRRASLAIYSFFLLPGLNLLVPAAVFLALHIGYHRRKSRVDKAKPSIVPASIGLVFLLAVNIVFVVSIETTISEHQVTEDSNWTFGQTLAVLLLALPLRDVFDFVVHVRHDKRRERCTQELKVALNAGNMDKVKRVVKYADIRDEATGMLSNLPLVYQS
jgi:hypothetical protein